jgi:hypothetical protein
MMETPRVVRPDHVRLGDAIIYQRNDQHHQKLGVVVAVDNIEGTVTVKPLELQPLQLHIPELPRIVYFSLDVQYSMINFVNFDIRHALVIHESHFDIASDSPIEYLRGINWVFRYQGDAENYGLIVRSPAFTQYMMCIRMSRAIRKALQNTKSSTHISLSLSISADEWMMIMDWFENHDPTPAQMAVRISSKKSTYDNYFVADKTICHEAFKTKIEIITTTIHVEVLERKLGLPSLIFPSRHENVKLRANQHVEAECGILFNRVLRGGETTRPAVFKYDKENMTLAVDLPVIRTRSTNFGAILDAMCDRHNDRSSQPVQDPNYMPGTFIRSEGAIFEVVEVRMHPQVDRRRTTVSNNVKYLHCINIETRTRDVIFASEAITKPHPLEGLSINTKLWCSCFSLRVVELVAIEFTISTRAPTGSRLKILSDSWRGVDFISAVMTLPSSASFCRLMIDSLHDFR